MNSGVVRLDQGMSILEQATTAVFTALFCFIHAEHNLIKLYLYNNCSAQAFNGISECAMWNSKRPNKFAHL